MAPVRFRPQLVACEDRATPAAASPAQLLADFATIRADGQFLAAFNQHPEYLTTGVYQPFTAKILKVVMDRDAAAAANVRDFADALRAQAAADPGRAGALAPAIQAANAAQFQAATNAAVASLDFQYVVQAIGFDPTVPPAPPPPPAVPPTTPTGTGGTTVPTTTDVSSDSGLTGTLPDISSSEFQTSADGLKTRDVSVGTGTAAKTGSTVSVYYTGFLTDGTRFDSRRSPSSPASFQLTTGQVIQGFAEGLVGMKPGGVRQIVIPPELGYGASGQGSIPPNSTLVFEVKLISTT